MKKLIIISSIILTQLSAFTFDGWQSQDTLDMIKEQAKSKKINLRNMNNENRINKYDKVNTNNTAIIYGYDTSLLNRDTTVKLYFDKKNKKLYKAEVFFNLMGTNTGEFIEKVYSILDRKYENSHLDSDYYENWVEEISGRTTKPYDTRYWEPDGETLIITKTTFSSLKVTYIDPRLFNEPTSPSIKDEKEFVKDYSRF